MDIRAAEISEILKRQIAGFDAGAEVAEVGQVLSVGDGIARVWGLDGVQAGETVEFPGGIRGMALNLETDNVGVVIFGDDRTIREGDTVKRTGAIVDVPVGKGLLGRVVDALGDPIDGKGPVEATERRRVDVKAPGIVPAPFGARAHADGAEGHRLAGAHRARPARIDHRRPPDRQDRRRGGRHRQPEIEVQRKRRRVAQALLHLCRDRPEALHGGAASSRLLEDNGALDYSIVVAATASEPAPLQFLAPYHRLHDGRVFPRQRDARAHHL